MNDLRELYAAEQHARTAQLGAWGLREALVEAGAAAAAAVWQDGAPRVPGAEVTAPH